MSGSTPTCKTLNSDMIPMYFSFEIEDFSLNFTAILSTASLSDLVSATFSIPSVSA